jgi:hypothetical protein
LAKSGYDKLLKHTFPVWLKINKKDFYEYDFVKKQRDDILEKYGKLEWPCAPGSWDDYEKRLRRSGIDLETRVEMIKEASVAYTIKKDLLNYLTSFAEGFLIRNLSGIIPTFNHKSSIDFFYNGLAVDEKTSRSVVKDFYKDYPNVNPYDRPDLVAKAMCEHQGKDWFSDERRMTFIIPEEKEYNIEDIRSAVERFAKDPDAHRFNIKGVARRKPGKPEFEQEVYLIMV